MKKQICLKCNNLFSLRGGNYKKHTEKCNGIYVPFKKLTCCKYCGLNFDQMSATQRASHSRWCLDNPKREIYLQRDMSYLQTPEIIAKRNRKVKDAHARGAYSEAPKKAYETRKEKGTLCHTTETKELLRQKALASNHRRILRSTRKYIKKDGSEVLLDSSWEEVLAKRLDELNIDWVRPSPIRWQDDLGKSHNYFPDFYLTEHDIYLDPKNEMVYKLSEQKIKHITKILPNLKILRSLKECKEFKI